VPEPDPPAQLLPEESLGVVQRAHRLGLGLPIAQDADEDLDVPQVRADLHVGDGDEADPRVLHLALEDRADLLLEELPEPG